MNYANEGGANRIHCLTSYPGWSGKLKLDTEGVENGHGLQYPVRRITSSAQHLSQCRQEVIT